MNPDRQFIYTLANIIVRCCRYQIVKSEKARGKANQGKDTPDVSSVW